MKPQTAAPVTHTPTRQQVIDCVNMGYGFLGVEGELTKDYMVRAVNSHEEMVAALKLVTADYSRFNTPEDHEAREACLKALAKAEGR